MSGYAEDPRFRASEELVERGTGHGPGRHLLITLGIGVVLLAILGFANFRVSIGPWMLFFALGGAIWWVLSVSVPTARKVEWRTPQAEQAPQRFTADMDTRRTVNVIDQAQPGKGFSSAALAKALAERAHARLVRRHGLPDDDPLAHARGLLSPQLVDYLSRADTDEALTITPRTLRAYLKEIEAL